MIRRPPRSTLDRSSAASDVYKRRLDVLHLDADVVEALPPGGQELRDTRVLRRRADELHPAHAVAEDGGLHGLLGHLLHVGQLEAEGVPPQRDALLEIPDHDGDVVESLRTNGHLLALLTGWQCGQRSALRPACRSSRMG